MKIDGFGINGIEIQNQYRNEIRKRERAGKLNGETVQAEESVSLREGTEIEAKIREQQFTDEISEEKINEIKSAIEKNEYSVSVHKIADSIVKEILGL